MPPKNFADDGASGAIGGSTEAPTPGGDGVATGGGTPPSVASGGVDTSSPASSMPAPGSPAPGSYVQPTGPVAGPAPTLPGAYVPPTGTGDTPAPGFSFADGGAIPDDSGGDDSDGSPEQDLMAQALESVDKTLQYTYQKYGGSGQQVAGAMPTIPGSQSETGGGTYGPGGTPPKPQELAGAMPTIPGSQSETGGGTYGPGGTPPAPQPQQPQQMASNMPTIPGSQSNSGIPPAQPMPGPLPPTSNPFGKRADDDSDDNSGAIDTESA